MYVPSTCECLGTSAIIGQLILAQGLSIVLTCPSLASSTPAEDSDPQRDCSSSTGSACSPYCLVVDSSRLDVRLQDSMMVPGSDGPVGNLSVRFGVCEHGLPSSRRKVIFQQLKDVECGLLLCLPDQDLI